LKQIRMETWELVVSVISAVIALAAAIFAWLTWQTAEEQSNRNMIISAVQSRVNSCIVLSRHHYEITNQHKIADVFADTSRALSLCLVELDHVDDDSFKKFENCVRRANDNDEHKLHKLEPKYGTGVAC